VQKTNIISLDHYAIFNGSFMIQFPTYPYFENSAKEFYFHKTLSTLALSFLFDKYCPIME